MRCIRPCLRRFLGSASGFSAAEAALLACVLGAACIVVGLKLSQGAATAASNVDGEIATGSPTQGGGARPPLEWRVRVSAIRDARPVDPPRGQFPDVRPGLSRSLDGAHEIRGPRGTYEDVHFGKTVESSPGEAAPPPDDPAPAPKGAKGAAKAPPDPNAQRWTDIQTILNHSALGKQALARLKAYKTRIRWAAGGGTYYDPTTNTITIDTTASKDLQALNFVHEINHDHYAHKGLNDINKLSRVDFVDGKLREEAEGTVLSIRAKEQIDHATGKPLSDKFPLEDEYEDAYGKAKKSGKTDAEAQGAGLQRVVDGFKNGEVQTSNTSEKYPDYYGKMWDGAHPPPPPAPPPPAPPPPAPPSWLDRIFQGVGSLFGKK